MAVFKCKMCGGSLDISEGVSVATCEYCGTKQTVPKSRDEVVSNLFNRANNLRLKCEFDKAEQVYEKILDIDNIDAEAHWGIVLCKYGIEYVEDPQTFARIPTCHRTLYEAVLADVNYLSAIENADEEQKELYIAEAKIIDELQKNILNIVNSEEPFDIFICYKETDENGKRTIDSAITNDIYYQLTQEGFKVFYAPITLEDKLGHEYEPYIFAALNSSKVMLVVGTKPEYFDSVWVRNEWSRFFKSMKNDRSKLLIPCYRDMDVYELPDEFAHLQAQDMGKIGFISDVIRGLKKVFNRDEQVQSTTVKKKSKKPSKIKQAIEKMKMKRQERKRFCLRLPLHSLCIALFIISLFLSVFFICYDPDIMLDMDCYVTPVFIILGLVVPLLILLKFIKNKSVAIILQAAVLVFSVYALLTDYNNMCLEVCFEGILNVLLQLIWLVLICCSKKTEKVNIKKLNKIKVLLPSVAVSLSLCIVLGIGGMNFCDYLFAKITYNMGLYENASAYFRYLDYYKDSKEWFEKSKLHEIKNAELFEVISLGNKESVKVLAKENNKVLVIDLFSETNLANVNIIGGWKKSTVRTYLNGEYYKYLTSFIKERVVTTKLSNSSDVNDVTEDKIFLLGDDEIERFLPSHNQKLEVSVYGDICLRTVENIRYKYIDNGVIGTISYSADTLPPKDANGDGEVTLSEWYDYHHGSEANAANRLRELCYLPAMWIDLSEIE